MRISGLLVMVFVVAKVSAQTCCTGGTPLLGSFVTPSLDSRGIKVSFTYSHNNNHDLFSGSDEIEDSFLQRKVNSTLLQIDYGLFDNISISLIAPYLFQNETISQSGNSQTFTNNGLSDISFWINYNKVFPSLDISIAGGVKLPTGSTNTTSNNIPLPLSLQTGSGSWDGGINLQSIWYPFASKKWSFQNQLGLKINTKGKSFEAHPNYRFGNLAQILGAVSYNYTIGTLVTNTFLGGVFQNRAQDEFNGGFENENTGGDWINVFIGQSLSLSEGFDISLNGQIPIYRSLEGLQLTTSYQASLVLSYTIPSRDEKNIFN